ncbi:hypothetical protein [Chitiniphilus shinanonensis]|uniref:hypothetical protein n=1 Tax=Chitiniphilus shinanonensis TaxID=553088 RepID=UPI00333FEF51
MATNQFNSRPIALAIPGTVICLYPSLVISPAICVQRLLTGKIELVPVTALYIWLASAALLAISNCIFAVLYFRATACTRFWWRLFASACLVQVIAVLVQLS